MCTLNEIRLWWTQTMPYRLDESTGLIDYDTLEKTATLYRPKVPLFRALHPTHHGGPTGGPCTLQAACLNSCAKIVSCNVMTNMTNELISLQRIVSCNVTTNITNIRLGVLWQIFPSFFLLCWYLQCPCRCERFLWSVVITLRSLLLK